MLLSAGWRNLAVSIPHHPVSAPHVSDEVKQAREYREQQNPQSTDSKFNHRTGHGPYNRNGRSMLSK